LARAILVTMTATRFVQTQFLLKNYTQPRYFIGNRAVQVNKFY